MHGFCSLVLPVRTGPGRPAVLKLSFDGDASRVGRALDEDDRAWITRCITIAKSVQG